MVSKTLRFKRTVAFILDMMILNLLIVYPFRDIYYKLLGYHNWISFNSLSDNLLKISLIIMIYVYFYFVLLEYYSGQTIGKIIMDLKVVKLNRRPISLTDALLRNIYLIPIFPFNLLMIIEFFVFYYKGERLSDIFLNIKTIEVKR